ARNSGSSSSPSKLFKSPVIQTDPAICLSIKVPSSYVSNSLQLRSYSRRIKW
ncbi:hypothetical protein COCCADRAFT_100749, partial [Bipolaris zeicola 26-R-13]